MGGAGRSGIVGFAQGMGSCVLWPGCTTTTAFCEKVLLSSSHVGVFVLLSFEGVLVLGVLVQGVVLVWGVAWGLLVWGLLVRGIPFCEAVVQGSILAGAPV